MVHVYMQIVKQEWPQNWTTFVSDIVGASKTSESLCTNNMAILKLLRSSILHWVLVSLLCVFLYRITSVGEKNGFVCIYSWKGPAPPTQTFYMKPQKIYDFPVIRYNIPCVSSVLYVMIAILSLLS